MCSQLGSLVHHHQNIICSHYCWQQDKDQFDSEHGSCYALQVDLIDS